MKKYRIGYTTGVFDMFHVGHLNLLEQSKELCETLIVGVSTDEVVENNKNAKPIIPFQERFKIIEAIRYVDQVVPQESYSIEEKIRAAKIHKIDVMFVGDDWKGTEKWNIIENQLNELGIKVEYIQYTTGISSTILRSKLKNERML